MPMLIADLTKEFHCARCGIVQNWCDSDWIRLFVEHYGFRIDIPCCKNCFRDVEVTLSSPLPPSATSQQT